MSTLLRRATWFLTRLLIGRLGQVVRRSWHLDLAVTRRPIILGMLTRVVAQGATNSLRASQTPAMWLVTVGRLLRNRVRNGEFLVTLAKVGATLCGV